MQGGTFTISSIGGIGGTQFTQIVNAPEVAILGATRAATKPVWDGMRLCHGSSCRSASATIIASSTAPAPRASSCTSHRYCTISAARHYRRWTSLRALFLFSPSELTRSNANATNARASQRLELLQLLVRRDHCCAEQSGAGCGGNARRVAGTRLPSRALVSYHRTAREERALRTRWRRRRESEYGGTLPPASSIARIASGDSDIATGWADDADAPLFDTRRRYVAAIVRPPKGAVLILRRRLERSRRLPGASARYRNSRYTPPSPSSACDCLRRSKRWRCTIRSLGFSIAAP